jgi:hypothetical protein
MRSPILKPVIHFSVTVTFNARLSHSVGTKELQERREGPLPPGWVMTLPRRGDQAEQEEAIPPPPARTTCPVPPP